MTSTIFLIKDVVKSGEQLKRLGRGYDSDRTWQRAMQYLKNLVYCWIIY